MQPWDQFSPRCTSPLPLLLLQAWLHACTPACARVGLVSASRSSDAVNPPTLFSPIRFWPCWSCWFPTTASANATVFDVPSVTVLTPYDCCMVNIPVLGQLIDGTLSDWLLICGQFIVVP